MKRIGLILAFLLVSFLAFGATVTRYVDTDVSGGAGDGTSWADAFSSLSAAEAALDGGSNGGNDLIIECRASSGTADTTSTPLSGFTYDSVTVRAASTDVAVKTGWDTSRYRLSVTDADGIYITDSGVTIDGLQVEVLAGGSPGFHYGIEMDGGSGTVKNCYVRTNYERHRGIDIGNGVGDGNKIYNTIVFASTEDSNTHWGINIDDSTDVYNCVVRGPYDIGIRGSEAVGDTVNVKNCAVFNCTDDISDGGAGTFTIDYNASDDGDGTNAVSPSGADWANEYAGYATGNFTLTAGGNCEGGGTDDPGSGLYSTDIDGDSYTSTWSIGVDAKTGAPPAGAMPLGPLSGPLGGPLAGIFGIIFTANGLRIQFNPDEYTLAAIVMLASIIANRKNRRK